MWISGMGCADLGFGSAWNWAVRPLTWVMDRFEELGLWASHYQEVGNWDSSFDKSGVQFVLIVSWVLKLSLSNCADFSLMQVWIASLINLYLWGSFLCMEVWRILSEDFFKEDLTHSFRGSPSYQAFGTILRLIAKTGQAEVELCVISCWNPPLYFRWHRCRVIVAHQAPAVRQSP